MTCWAALYGCQDLEYLLKVLKENANPKFSSSRMWNRYLPFCFLLNGYKLRTDTTTCHTRISFTDIEANVFDIR